MILTASEVDFVMRQLDVWVARGLERLDGRGAVEPLRELHLELTHRCNLKCVMCHHWEMPSKDPDSVRREMGLEGIRKLVSESRLLRDIEIIALTGGEPWLRPDIDDIIVYLREYFPKASIGVLTNFANTELLRRHLQALKRRGVKNLWLGSSLDGLEETHDRMRGRKGAFRGLMETAAMVRREFPGMDFSFSFTITPKNYRELLPSYRLVKEMGLWFGAQMVVDHQGLDAPESFTWRKDELVSVSEQIDEILLDICRGEGAMKLLLDGRQRESRWLWSRLLYWRYLRKYGRRPERFFEDCLAGQRYAMFDPEGNLFFCPVNKHRTIGKVGERGFDSLWTSARAKSERGFVESNKCDCWLNCVANPVLDRVLAEGVE